MATHSPPETHCTCCIMGGTLSSLGVQTPSQRVDDLKRDIVRLEKANAMRRDTNSKLKRKIEEMAATTSALAQAAASTHTFEWGLDGPSA